MSEHRITPEKVTRPIQLLAAWLTGLIIIDGSFLVAASQIAKPEWSAGVLVIASVINVPLFLISIFVLQTKFRPEMQEDVYYSKYLEQQYSGKQSPPKPVDAQSQIRAISESIIEKLAPELESRREPLEKILAESQIKQIASRVGDERSISELYLRPEMWFSIVEEWEDNETFTESLDKLIEEGVVTFNDDYYSCQLTLLGRQVAEYAEKNDLLFSQQPDKKEWWNAEGEKHLTRTSSGRAKSARR